MIDAGMFAPTLVGQFASHLVKTDALNFKFTGGMTGEEIADYLLDEFDAFVGDRLVDPARARRVVALATQAASEAYRPIRWTVSGWHIKRG